MALHCGKVLAPYSWITGSSPQAGSINYFWTKVPGSVTVGHCDSNQWPFLRISLPKIITFIPHSILFIFIYNTHFFLPVKKRSASKNEWWLSSKPNRLQCMIISVLTIIWLLFLTGWDRLLICLYYRWLSRRWCSVVRTHSRLSGVQTRLDKTRRLCKLYPQQWLLQPYSLWMGAFSWALVVRSSQ